MYTQRNQFISNIAKLQCKIVQSASVMMMIVGLFNDATSYYGHTASAASVAKITCQYNAYLHLTLRWQWSLSLSALKLWRAPKQLGAHSELFPLVLQVTVSSTQCHAEPLLLPVMKLNVSVLKAAVAQGTWHYTIIRYGTNRNVKINTSFSYLSHSQRCFKTSAAAYRKFMNAAPKIVNNINRTF